jgi:pyrroline-5-carboxylate reductase
MIDNKTQVPTIAVIGCGNMARAMLGGLVGTEIDKKYHFNCSSRSIESAQVLAGYFHSSTSMIDNSEAVAQADKVILAIKPQQAQKICQEIAAKLSSDCHIISVMAGINVQTLSQWCKTLKISRVMPNTPALIGQGMSGVFHHSEVGEKDRAFITTMVNNVGKSITVDDEDKIHSITAVSGSGPAYFFHFIYQMQKAAEEFGFSPEQAEELVKQTALGAVKLVAESDDDALTLQKKVCSPGGTTEQAINTFEHLGTGKIIQEAMKACYKRSVELSAAFRL